MSRFFTRVSSQGLAADVAGIDDVVFTISAWFFALDVTAAGTIVGIVDKDQTSRRIALWVRGDKAGDPLDMMVHYGGTAQASTSTGYSASTWHHACGVSRSATDKSVFLDGGGEGTDATSTDTDLSGLDRTSIGYLGDSTPSQYFDGRVGEVGIWDVDLIDEEVGALAAGAAPPLVRPGSLVTYVPLIRADDNDIMGTTGAYSLVGAPGIRIHTPGMVYPEQPQAVWTPGAAAPATPSHDYLAAHAVRLSGNRRLRM